MVAVIAAGAATAILRPRSGLIEPAAVDETAYFSQAQLQRASDFRDPQRILGLAGLAVTGGTLALVALRPPPRLDALLERDRRRPVVAGAVVAAGVSVVLVAAGLPLDAAAHRRAVNVGLSVSRVGSAAPRCLFTARRIRGSASSAPPLLEAAPRRHCRSHPRLSAAAKGTENDMPQSP